MAGPSECRGAVGALERSVATAPRPTKVVSPRCRQVSWLRSPWAPLQWRVRAGI